MVSSVGHCNDDSMLIVDDPSSLSYCNSSSLDFNTSSTLHVSHACVDSPCISCRNCLTKTHDDMLAMSCCHDKNASISSNCCANNVEETEHCMEQDVVFNGASRDPTLSSILFALWIRRQRYLLLCTPICLLMMMLMLMMMRIMMIGVWVCCFR